MELRRIILVTALAIAQLASAGYASAMVICLGGDGHVAIELIHDVCDQPRDEHPQACGVDAHPCQDLPLPSNPSLAMPRRSGQDHDAVSAAIPLLLLVGSTSSPAMGQLSGPLPPGQPQARGPALTLLRSVVLTI